MKKITRFGPPDEIRLEAAPAIPGNIEDPKAAPTPVAIFLSEFLREIISFFGVSTMAGYRDMFKGGVNLTPIAKSGAKCGSDAVIQGGRCR